METRKLEARFTTFELPVSVERSDTTVAIPVSKGLQQEYFFMNLKTGRGLRIDWPKRAGLLTIEAWGFVYHFCTYVMNKNHKAFPRIRTLFCRYHNGVSIFEILFKLSKPHGITYVGDQKYLVSLWLSSTYFLIDVKERTIETRSLYKANTPRGIAGRISRALAVKEKQEIFSTYQCFDPRNRETYFATQLRDRGKVSSYHKEFTNYDVPIRIRKYNWQNGTMTEIWQGNFGEAAHYIALNKDGRYLGLVQFGDFFDKDMNLLPSKILILDLQNRKEWWIDNVGWSPSAHIDWDPIESDICYLSCHNGVIVPVDNPIKFLFQKVYNWKLFGPASIHKYSITERGPEKKGVFTHSEMFRMTIHKVFVHRHKTLIACTGFPNFVFLVDADSLTLIRRVELREKSGAASVLGSISPAPGGEKIYAITTRSFQVIDVAGGRVGLVYDLGKIYDPFNHMTSVADANW